MTERPEERDFQEGANPDVQGTMNRANTEPPYPKRDSQKRVAAIEGRLAASYAPPGEDHGADWSDGFDWAEAMRDIRTLINELTELREQKKLATQQAVDAINRKVTVENDLAELRERNEELEVTRRAMLRRIETQNTRIKQMEEALREAYDYFGEIGHGIPDSVFQLVQALTQGTEKP